MSYVGPMVLGNKLARPERFELPTNWFEASYSIQLSYGRVDGELCQLPACADLFMHQSDTLADVRGRSLSV